MLLLTEDKDFNVLKQLSFPPIKVVNIAEFEEQLSKYLNLH